MARPRDPELNAEIGATADPEVAEALTAMRTPLTDALAGDRHSAGVAADVEDLLTACGHAGPDSPRKTDMTDSFTGEDSREVVIATVGKAHGLRGEVALRLRTDDPERRLVSGQILRTDDPDRPELTIARVRRHGETWLVGFEGHTDRTAAESLRGLELLLDVDPAAEAEEDPGAWYAEDLAGLSVRHVDGTALGTVIGLEHYPAQDLLVINHDGRSVLVPFVDDLVPAVDLEAEEIVLDPPGGLFDAGDTPEAGTA